MTLLIFLSAIVLLLIVLLFTVKSKVNLVFDSTRSDMHMTLFWLYPLLKSTVTREDSEFILTAYLFNKKILTRKTSRLRNASSKENVLKIFSPTEIHVDTHFGFRDPFITGLACSAITMVSEFFNVESLHQEPDFLAVNDYISLDATARLNLGNSLMKLI